MEDKIFIRHDFVIEQDGKRLQDAICLPIDDYNKLSKEDIEKIKQQRWDNWIYVITHPVQEPEIPDEEKLANLEKDLAVLEEQKTILLSQKAEVQAVIASKPIKPKEVIGEK